METIIPFQKALDLWAIQSRKYRSNAKKKKRKRKQKTKTKNTK